MTHHDDRCPERFSRHYEVCQRCRRNTCEKCFGVRLPDGVYCNGCGRYEKARLNLEILLGVLSESPGGQEILTNYESKKYH